MRRRDFYKAIYDEVQTGIAILNDRANEIAVREQKIASGKYSVAFVAKLREEIHGFEEEMKRVPDEYIRKINTLIDQRKAILEDEVALRGSDINDDARLLDFNLGARELVALLKRNADNPTMTQLILKNAADRNIALGVWFVGNKAEIDSLDGISYAAKVAMNHYKTERVFNQLFGEGSPIEQQYNIDDQEKQEKPAKIAYSDDRIANAVRLLKESHTLSTVVQEDIIREFSNQQGVLSILKDAAEQGRQYEAVALAEKLLTGESE